MIRSSSFSSHYCKHVPESLFVCIGKGRMALCLTGKEGEKYWVSCLSIFVVVSHWMKWSKKRGRKIKANFSLLLTEYSSQVNSLGSFLCFHSFIRRQESQQNVWHRRVSRLRSGDSRDDIICTYTLSLLSFFSRIQWVLCYLYSSISYVSSRVLSNHRLVLH